MLLLATALSALGQGPLVSQNLAPPSSEPGGHFGQSVAATDETLFIGAPGVDGTAPGSGAVYAYERAEPGSNWTLTGLLLPAIGASGDDFGQALAAEGDLVAVAAPGGGAVHVFEAGHGGGWVELQRIVAAGDELDVAFGGDVSLSGQHLLVGAPERGQGAGGAYLFERQSAGGRFAFRQGLVATGSPPGAAFGQRLALSGDLAVISAPLFRIPDAIPGQQSVGAAYLFARNAAGSLTQLQALAPGYPAPIEEFGADVDLDGRTAVIGVPCRDLHGMPGAGTALVLEPIEGKGSATSEWKVVRELSASNAQSDDGFGGAVAIRGDTLLVGAPDTPFGGTVYAFGRDVGGPGAWGQFGRIGNPTGGGDFFGSALDHNGGAGVIGAPSADAGSIGSAGAATVVEGLGSGGP